MSERDEVIACIFSQEDERRIATVMGRKEEEKKRENSKMAILVVSCQQCVQSPIRV